MSDDGTCPTCGAECEAPTSTDGDETAPWHFKLLVVATVAYIVWRVVDLVN